MDNGVLQADYETLETVMKQFQTLHERINTLTRNLSNQTETLCTEGWLGEGSEAFHAEMTEKVLPSLTRMFQSFELAAALTNEISTTLHDAEERSCNLFRA